MWYLIVSTPDLCTLAYFDIYIFIKIMRDFDLDDFFHNDGIYFLVIIIYDCLLLSVFMYLRVIYFLRILNVSKASFGLLYIDSYNKLSACHL